MNAATSVNNKVFGPRRT